MVATSQYHSPEDAALRILPAVAPLAVDPVGEVCEHARLCFPGPPLVVLYLFSFY
jgi:SCY1-like protein 1